MAAHNVVPTMLAVKMYMIEGRADECIRYLKALLFFC